MKNLPGIVPPSLLALFSNPGSSDAPACSLLKRGVWLDRWGRAHPDVTIPLPCGGISEADTTWSPSGTCCHPQPAQEALTFLPLAGEHSKGQVRKKHFAPSLLQTLFWGLLARQDFRWVLSALKPHCDNFPGSLRHTWDLCEHRFLQWGIYLGRNFCFLCLIFSSAPLPLLPLVHPRCSWTPGSQGYVTPPSSSAQALQGIALQSPFAFIMWPHEKIIGYPMCHNYLSLLGLP